MLLCWVPGNSFFFIGCTVCGSPFVLVKKEEALGLMKMREESLIIVAVKSRMVFSTCTPLAAFLCVTRGTQGWMLMGCITANGFGERLALGSWV